METHTRAQLIDAFLHDTCLPLLKSKGQSYAQTDRQPDVNGNFKRAAAVWGTTTLQAWGVYFGKHIDAIETYIRTGGKFESEPIEQRIADAVNYLLILYTLLREDGTIVGDTQADGPPSLAGPPARMCSSQASGSPLSDLHE